jgi:hypothetical protein
MPLSSRSAVGLDIGTSAVRAARVTIAKGKSSLAGFGQVALPHGAVSEERYATPARSLRRSRSYGSARGCVRRTRLSAWRTSV